MALSRGDGVERGDHSVRARGWAVPVDPIKPMLKPFGTKRLETNL